MDHRKVIILVIFLLSFSCSKNPISNENQTQSLSGIVDGWQNGVFLNKLDIGISDTSNFIKLDSTIINNDGSFSFSYPFPTPSDSVLKSYVPQQDSNNYFSNFDNIVMSKPNVRYVPIYFCVYISQHQLRMTLFPSNRYLTSDSTSTIGDYFIQYYYFDQSTTIMGSHRLSFYVPPSSVQSKYNIFITNVNLNVSIGWNRIVTQIEQIHDSTIVYQVSADVFRTPKWFPSWFDSRNFDGALHF